MKDIFGKIRNQITYDIVACAYLATFVIAGMIFGLTPAFYFAFLIFTAIFILPAVSLGLDAIILLTMLFERFFTLAPLTVGESIYKLYPLDIVFGITAIALLLNVMLKKIKIKKVFGWPEKTLLAFIALAAIYLLRSYFDSNAEMAIAFSTFKNYAFYPLLYFLTIFLVQTPQKLKNAVHLILTAGAMIIFFIVFGLINGRGLWTEFTPLSTAGVRYLAGTHAFYLILASLLAISLIAFNRFWHNSLPTLILWIWGIGIAGSLMRHLWLALTFGLAILFITLPKNNKIIFLKYSGKNLLAVLSVAAIFFAAIGIFPYFAPMNNFTDYLDNLSQRAISIAKTASDTSIGWRLELWRSAQTEWLNNPMFGIGFGKKIWLEYNDWQNLEEVRNMHNSPLAILVQMGIIGLLTFSAAIIAIIIKSWKNIFKNQELTPYYLGLLAGVFALGFASFFQPYLETNLTGIFLWILLGLLRSSETMKNT